MATVFLAHDIKHDRSVALKVLHPEVAAALGAERFLREIRIAAHLQHPHILTLIDSGEIPRRDGMGPGLLRVRMWGCWRCAAMRISRRNRSAPSAAATSGWRTLRATERSCLMSCARNTAAMPPRPTSRSTL